DRAVHRVELRYRLGDRTLAARTLDANRGLSPMATVQVADTLDLAAHALANQEQRLVIEATAFDQFGQASVPVTANVAIRADTTAPQASISAPVAGASLYAGEQVNVQWRAVDDSQLKRVQIKANGAEVFNQTTFSGKEASGSFAYRVPETLTELVLSLTATDVFGNSDTSHWQFDVGTDEPPVVSIRHPAAGSRYVEGESFTINALVSDDREIAQVVFIKRVGPQDQVIKTIGRQDAARLVAANEYFSAALRVPHNPADQPMSVLVRATDSIGQVTEVPLDLQILDDQEAPVVNMTVPAQNLEHYPGESFDVSGTASDNQYIGELAAYFVDEQGQEIRVDWEVLGRKDRLEQVRVANQNTIGSIVAAERFFTDCNARVRIPTGFVDYTGQSLTFKVRASDHGINSSDSPSIQVRIKADQIGRASCRERG